MNIDREQLMAFVKEYEILLDRKKSILADTKEFIDIWVEEHDIEKKKPFMNAVKSFIKWQNDKAKVEDETNAFDEFFNILTSDTKEN
jgi:hypothetical protein